MQATKNILVAINVHDHDVDQVIQSAKQLALTKSATLHVVYIVQHLCSSGLRCRLKQARHEVDLLVDQYHLNKSTVHVRVGRVKTVVLEEAKRLSVESIVIGDHEKSGWYRFMMPVVSFIKQEAECEVVAVPLAYSEADVPAEESVISYA